MRFLAATQPTVTVTTHPDGFAHTRATIAIMSKLARKGSHTYAIRSLATRIVHGVPSKQVRGELLTLYQWVRDNIRYRFDPLGLEWVQAPERTVLERSGDCDDMATLLAAMAGSLGHKWRFLTVGPTPAIMKHVAAEVFDGREWVTLDPVLEPPGQTTAPRDDAGMFGRSAPARARHLWSTEGEMLSGFGSSYSLPGLNRGGPVRVGAYTRRWPRRSRRRNGRMAGPVGTRGVALWDSQLGNVRLVHVEPHAKARAMLRAGLSGPVSTEERELWSWAAYYPSDPTNWAGAGIAPNPSPVYRSGDAPGYMDGRPIVISAPPGMVEPGMGYIDGLGMGSFLSKIGKAVGGVVKGVTNVVTKIPGVSLLAKVIPGASLALDAAKMVGGILSPGKSGGGGAPAAAAPQALTAGGAAPSPYAPEGSGPAAGGGGAPVRIPTNIAQRTDIDALRQEVRANSNFATRADIVGLQSLLANRNSAENQKKAAAARKAQSKAQASAIKKARAAEVKRAKKAIAKLQKKQGKAIAKLAAKLKKAKAHPCPTVGAKYPAGSRQQYDAKANKYRVYAPAGAVSGLGFIKPTLTLSLGGFGAFGVATAAQAASAIVAVDTFIKKNRAQPPQMALPAVKALQAADGTLKPDGLWGPNTRAAAAYYLSKPITALPPVAKPYASSKVTWRPPASKAPPAAIAAAAKPPKAKKPKAPAAIASKPKTTKPKALPARTAANVVPIRPKASSTSSAYAPAGSAPRRDDIDVGTRASTLPVQVVKTPVPSIPPRAPAGLVPAGIEDANPGLPPVGIDSTSSPSIVIDVKGPRIRRDPFEAPAVTKARAARKAGKARKHRHHAAPGGGGTDMMKPALWLALGWYLLHGRRRAA